MKQNEIEFRAYGNEDGKGLKIVVIGLYKTITARRELYIYKDEHFKYNGERWHAEAKDSITKQITQQLHEAERGT